MGFPGDDEHDVHVHAAAATCGAAYMITADKSFHDVADELPYEVHTADSFFYLVAENVPRTVDAVIRRQLEYYRGRGKSTTLHDALVLAGCPTFAEIVHQHLRAMSVGQTTAGIAAGVEFDPVVDLDTDEIATPAAAVEPNAASEAREPAPRRSL